MHRLFKLNFCTKNFVLFVFKFLLTKFRNPPLFCLLMNTLHLKLTHNVHNFVILKFGFDPRVLLNEECCIFFVLLKFVSKTDS